eukprot:283845-Pyramimonas_sp.AAC.1
MRQPRGRPLQPAGESPRRPWEPRQSGPHGRRRAPQESLRGDGGLLGLGPAEPSESDMARAQLSRRAAHGGASP